MYCFGGSETVGFILRLNLMTLLFRSIEGRDVSSRWLTFDMMELFLIVTVLRGVGLKRLIFSNESWSRFS